MRDIKFRMWVKSYKSMIYLLPTISKYDFEDGFVLSFVVDGYDEFGAHERYGSKKDDVVIMQYTGLKDKNDKDIYEGDIGYFDISKNVPTVIKIEEGAVNYWSLFNMGHKFEVVGNIHENPELI